MDKITYIAVLLTYIVFADIGAKGYVFYKTMEAREEVRSALFEQCMRTSNTAGVFTPSQHIQYCRREANKKLREMP